MSASSDARTDLLGRLTGDPVCWSREGRVGMLAEIEALRGWLEAREAVVLAMCHAERDDVSSGARDITQLCQQTAHVSYGTARRRALRALTLPQLPATAAALSAGALGSGQADEMCALAERLDPAVAELLEAAEAALVNELSAMTPVQARKRLTAFETEIAPEDPEARLEAQKKANRVRFARNSDGTTSIYGQLDPLSAAYLRTCIDNKVTELWRSQRSDRSDSEPPADVMSNGQRRADALIALIRDGHSSGPGARGHAELLVLIDYSTLIDDLNAAGIAQLSDSTPIPASEARRLACEANIIPMVLGGPSQRLDVGRSHRTATPAQKAAARALHDTCIIGNCDVAFEYCQLHHIRWWRHGGRTDLDNLVPLCSKHHHLIHDYNWQLRIDSNRIGSLHQAPHPQKLTPQPVRTSRPEPPPASQRAGPAHPARPLPQDAPAPMRC